MPNKKPNGPLLVFLGALFWSLNAPLVKFIDLDPILVAGLRSLIAGIVLFPFLNLKKLNFNRWTLAYIISYAGLCISIIMALSKTSATVAIGMQFSGIIWIFILNSIKDRVIRKRSLYSVVPIMMGITLFMLSSTSSTSLVGNLIALSEGLFFTGITIFVKKSETDNTLGLISIANLFTGLVSFSLIPGKISSIVNIGGQNFLVILILGVVQMALGYSFYTYGVQYTSDQRAAIISVWEMILGPVWVALFLKEIPNTMVLLGFILILIGMIIESYNGKDDDSREGDTLPPPQLNINT